MIATRRGKVRWLAVAAVLIAGADSARAQSGYFASIAYSQSTGKIGFSARQARTKPAADALALRMCASADAKVWMWARDQWVAIAVVDGQRGNAGFGRGDSAADAQQKALDECGKRAKGGDCRVALCVHSGGQRVRDEDLRRVAGKPIESRTGYFAAIAYSATTGKIGSTAGKAKTIDQAKTLAVKDCGAEDAKVFMWGDQWIAIAVAPSTPGIAGFSPGATREAAEKAALEQCAKYAKGAPCRIALALFSTGRDEAPVMQAAALQPAAATPPAPAGP
jgi:hypothetical protein